MRRNTKRSPSSQHRREDRKSARQTAQAQGDINDDRPVGKTITRARIKTFQDFCKQFTTQEIPHVVKIGKRYFYDPHDLLSLAQKHHWETFAVGLYLGEERQEFQPTSALIDLLAQYDTRRVTVGDKAAWLYLCGRDILMDGVFSAYNARHDERIILEDVQHNVLGFGRIVADYEGDYKNKTYVKHVLDKGEYLRREK